MYQKQVQISSQDSILALLPQPAQSCYSSVSHAIIRDTHFGRKLSACRWPFAQWRINAIPIGGPLTLNKKGWNTFSLREIQAFNRSGNLGQEKERGIATTGLTVSAAGWYLQLVTQRGDGENIFSRDVPNQSPAMKLLNQNGVAHWRLIVC